MHLSSTPYDDVFKTQLHDGPALIIPFINFAFDENILCDERVVFYPSELFADGENREVDGLLEIAGRLYHVECQSTDDDSMIVRLVEYDLMSAFAAAMRDGSFTRGRFKLRIPRTAVLWLRHTAATPDEMTIEAELPNGETSIWTIPSIKMDELTLDEIFSRRLYFLLPFYLFVYEKRFPELERDAAKRAELVREYEGLIERLRELSQDDPLVTFNRGMLINMMNKVTDHLAAKFTEVKKGVEYAMGGHVIDYEVKTARREGIAEGRAEGMANGIVKTERRYGASDDMIVSNLMTELSWDRSTAERFLREN